MEGVGKAKISCLERCSLKTAIHSDEWLNFISSLSSPQIVEATDGVEALKEIDSSPPNLIFMNIKLPRENGLELTKKIKASHPNVTVIIFTSSVMIYMKFKRQQLNAKRIISFQKVQ